MSESKTHLHASVTQFYYKLGDDLVGLYAESKSAAKAFSQLADRLAFAVDKLREMATLAEGAEVELHGGANCADVYGPADVVTRLIATDGIYRSDYHEAIEEELDEEDLEETAETEEPGESAK